MQRERTCKRIIKTLKQNAEEGYMRYIGLPFHCGRTADNSLGKSILRQLPVLCHKIMLELAFGMLGITAMSASWFDFKEIKFMEGSQS